MGFHLVDILIIAAAGLLLFGPKTLQSIARSTGKGFGQAKEVKDKLMADLPMEEIAKVKQSIPQVPLNSRQAVQMLINTEPKGKEQKKAVEEEKEPAPKSESAE